MSAYLQHLRYLEHSINIIFFNCVFVKTELLTILSFKIWHEREIGASVFIVRLQRCFLSWLPYQRPIKTEVLKKC